MPANPPPMTTRALVVSLLFAAIVSVFFWHSLPVYPLRLLVTLMHETGHALMAKLVGGEVESLTISPLEGGLTQSRFPDSFLNRMLVSSAGYVGSSIAGALLLALAGRMRSGRFILGALVVWMFTVAIVWVPFVPPATGNALVEAHSGFARTDGVFTWGFILFTGAVLALTAAKAPTWLRRAVIVTIATTSCLAALEDLKTLIGFGLGGTASDADAMQRITHLPAALWAGLWLCMSLFAIWLGLRSIVRRRASLAAQDR